MRVRKMMPGLFGAALLAAIPAHAHEAEADGAARVTIVTSDVDRFYALYDDPALAAQPEVVAARYLATPTPRSEEHTSELQSLMRTSYAVFRLKKKKIQQHQH